MSNNSVVTNTIVLEREELFNKLGSKPTKQIEYTQLKIGEPRQNTPEGEYPLTIERLPDALQWWSQTRYWIIHKDSTLRVPGSFSLDEARKIQKITQHWDWSIDSRDRKVACGLNLLALAEGICSQSSQQGGKP
jgi:hypothetical protein